MSKKVKQYNTGDCVEVSVFEHDDCDGFFHSAQRIGLVLEAELIQMGDNEQMNMHDEKEWMYRVILPDGKIAEVWDYEIKHVNIPADQYNKLSQ